MDRDICKWEIARYYKSKNYSWNPSTSICEYSKCLESVDDNSITLCDKMKDAAVLINFGKENIRWKTGYCVFLVFFFFTMLLFEIAFIYYHYTKHRPKQKILAH